MQIIPRRIRSNLAALLVVGAMTAAATPAASCAYKGRTYAEGATYQGSNCEFSCTRLGCSQMACTSLTRICENGSWRQQGAADGPYTTSSWQSCYFNAYGGSYWMPKQHPCSYWRY
jgi:hypothetical protein